MVHSHERVYINGSYSMLSYSMLREKEQTTYCILYTAIIGYTLKNYMYR